MSLLRRLFDLPALDSKVFASFRREQLTETTLPIAVSLMEGGFVAVVAAKTFDVPPWVLAVISASPMFGNLSSFLWNRVGSARPKVPMIVALQSLVLVCLLAIAAVAAIATSACGCSCVAVIGESAIDRRHHDGAQRRVEPELRPNVARACDRHGCRCSRA